MKWYTTAKTLKKMRVASPLKGAREKEKEDRLSSNKIDLCNEAVKELKGTQLLESSKRCGW